MNLREHQRHPSPDGQSADLSGVLFGHVEVAVSHDEIAMRKPSVQKDLGLSPAPSLERRLPKLRPSGLCIRHGSSIDEKLRALNPVRAGTASWDLQLERLE
jgi:hypothetical protein